MAVGRRPLQGIKNIIRFNWHFYLLVAMILLTLLAIQNFLPQSVQFVISGIIALSSLTVIVSLFVSYYIYDQSTLYDLEWLNDLNELNCLNIHAGFDETSELIQSKFPNCHLTICDFYNPEIHTEISIKRARKAFPPHPNNIRVDSQKLPFADHTFDRAFAILSAHEIRSTDERTAFFKELQRIIKIKGEIYIVEHLRDLNNMLAYSIGAFHFHSRSSWLSNFKDAGLIVVKESKITPFITIFKLKKHGITP